MTIPKFGNAEMHYIPMEEIRQHRIFDPKCWLDLSIVAIVFGGAIFGALIIIARMWIGLGEQVAAL